MPVDPSVQRKLDSMGAEAQKLRAQHQATQSAQSDKLKNDLEMLKNKKEQMLDADKKRKENLAQQSEDTTFDATELVEAMLLGEKAATGGFDYEKQINDTLKAAGKADPDAGTAGSSADAPDAKFTHNGEEHNLEIKQNSKAMYGQIELKHDGKSWDISERSKKKYPETHKAIADSGFLKKINKQWDKPTGDYDEDLKMGNVYHDHPNADPIKAHYGKDRKTNYIQIGGGHGFYHTGNDAAQLGSPELEGKTQFRARMKYRGTDKKTGQKKYGALIVMGLKDAEKSHHNLDNPTQKEWIEDIMKGHQLAEQAPVAPSVGVHRIAVTVSDPDHPMVTKRDEKLQKFVRVTHHDAKAAIERAKKHFAKKGWKVHDANYAGNVHESLQESHVEFRLDHRDKLTGNHKATFAAHDAKVSDTTDKATYVKVPSHKADSFKSAMKGHGAKVELAESRNQADKYWDEAEGHKVEAKKHKVGTEAHHFHMSNHYDAMHRYHSDIGQHREADKAADKAEEHHEKSLQASKNGMAEDVAVNNVGGGAIAGTQGDAGKKAVMTKEPLKRKPLTKFKNYVSQEHDGY